MLPPLDSRILSALVCDDDDDADSEFVIQAKRRLKTDRNLSLGVLLLLQTYGRFLAQLHQDRVPMYHERWGADSWHIAFRDPPFDDLRIYSTFRYGVIEIRVLNKPFLSFQMFDEPQNWQAMLQWLWEHGDERELARSIPQLDPRIMRALVDRNYSARESSQMDIENLTESQMRDDTSSIRTARKALMTGDIGRGMYKLLVAFQIFEPSLYRDKSPTRHANMEHTDWYIIFLVTPFRSLRLQPGQLEGMIDIYAFDKHVKSLSMTDSPQSWQAILEWLWNYGNKRHIEKAEYTASRSRPTSKAKRESKRRRVQKPLLHHVLRTAGFKTEGGSKTTLKDVEHMVEAADNVGRVSKQRQALHPASPNRQMRKSRLATTTTADEEDEILTPEGKT